VKFKHDFNDNKFLFLEQPPVKIHYKSIKIFLVKGK